MTAEVCPECGYPQGPYNLDPSFDCVCTGDINCNGRALARVKSQLRAAHACIEAADRIVNYPELSLRSAVGTIIHDAWLSARAEYERVTKGEGERCDLSD